MIELARGRTPKPAVHFFSAWTE